MLHIADYENIAKGNFALRSIQSIPEAEVYFRKVQELPLHNAREVAIKAMSEPELAPPPQLPFEIQDTEQPETEEKPLSVELPPAHKGFRIMEKRMLQFHDRLTPGCDACERFLQRGHTQECRERMRKLFEDEGVLIKQAIQVEPGAETAQDARPSGPGCRLASPSTCRW